MNNEPNTNQFAVSIAIAGALNTTNPGTERIRRLKAIRWVLQTKDGRFAYLSGMDCALTTAVKDAQVFDGRDNEATKAWFWEKQLGVSLRATLV